MAVAFLLIGVVLLITAARNTYAQLFTLLAGDFTGQNNFIFWMVSIILIGSIGYIPKAKPISTGLLGLVIVVLVLTKGKGFFGQLVQQVDTTETVTPKISPATSSSSSTSGLAGAVSGLLGSLPNVNIGGSSNGSQANGTGTSLTTNTNISTLPTLNDSNPFSLGNDPNNFGGG
jgi:hypothetical protein